MGAGKMMDNLIGYKLKDTQFNTWLVVAYQGDTLRVVNLEYHYLSEAEARTMKGLIMQLESIEEIEVQSVWNRQGLMVVGEF
jgi:hypothetical protein